jgi:hypothetical protein
LVEVKGTVPKVDLRSTDIKVFKEQLNKAYGVGITQCAKKESDIRNGFLKHKKIPLIINQIHYLVIALEDFWILPTEFVIESIREYAFSKGAVIPKSKTFHWMSINTLEDIIENDTRSIFDFLADRDTSNHTFSIAPCVDINSKREKSERRSFQYLSRLLDELNNSQIR